MAMSNQYTLYHLHSDLSNGVTNIDSVTKYGEYIERAKECGMKAMAFTEHGSVFEWWHKKSAIEAAGMKYIHGIEAYLTLNIDEKIRDNYHCVLLAKNYDGFLELNSLVSKSFCRTDNHFYYVPRITFNELFATSDNIIITTACVGGVLGKGDEQVQQYYLDFLERNKHRCFLEVGHHMDEKQVTYNEKLLLLSKSTGVPLIAGTDTHVLNAEHEKGRSILQASKNITFDGEERWDLKFKTYDELVAAYREQGSLPEAEYMQAIENTNVMADMVEPFELDRGTKYPHIYSEPEKTFRDKIQTAVENHPYALKHHTKEELQKTIDEEFDVYKATKSIDFMLLQTYLREWEKQNDIQCGYTKTDEFGYISYTDEGIAFASKIFEVLNEVKDNFTDAYSFNIESVPAERAAVILCQKDNVLYDHNDKFIYSNQWIPLSAKCTIQEKLRLSSILDEKCSGGSIAHINLESNFPNTETAWKMLNKIAQAGVIYFAFNTRINECKNHHGFVGTDHCPVCGEPVFDTYQRIVGYLVPSRAYSKDRFREFNTRQWYSYAEAMSE